MLLPITKEFEVTPAIRFDDYEDFGNTTNYKIAFRYQPSRQLLFRGSYGTGFKAPTVPQLNAAAQSFGVTGNAYSCNADPRLQAQADRLGAECPAGGTNIQFDQIAGGNQDLKPEESKQWTLGMRWEPTAQFGIGADLWEVKIDNSIGQIDEATVFGDPDKYPQGFTTFIEPSTGLNLLAYFGSNVNLGKSETMGIDFDITYRQPFTGGNFRTTFFGTYIFRNRYEVVPGQGYIDDLGKFTDGTLTFPFKAKWVNTLEMGNWEHTLAINYLTGYDDDRDNAVLDVAADEFVTLERRVSHYATADWQTRWRFAKNWTLTAGIWNIFSTRPPLTLTTNGGGQMIGYNADFSDPRDRTFYANINFRF
jgi:iron complex outermembrane receptor protein